MEQHYFNKCLYNRLLHPILTNLLVLPALSHMCPPAAAFELFSLYKLDATHCQVMMNGYSRLYVYWKVRKNSKECKPWCKHRSGFKNNEKWKYDETKEGEKTDRNPIGYYCNTHSANKSAARVRLAVSVRPNKPTLGKKIICARLHSTTQETSSTIAINS